MLIEGRPTPPRVALAGWDEQWTVRIPYPGCALNLGYEETDTFFAFRIT